MHENVQNVLHTEKAWPILPNRMFLAVDDNTPVFVHMTIQHLMLNNWRDVEIFLIILFPQSYSRDFYRAKGTAEYNVNMALKSNSGQPLKVRSWT